MENTKQYEELTKLFSKLGLKLTMQRFAILKYLMDSKAHPSAEMIFNDLKQQYPTITLSTVYNTLDVFEEKGLIKRVPTFTGTARYDADLSPHVHMILSDKGEILDIYDKDVISSIRQHLKRKHNLDISDKNIYLVISAED